MLASIGLVLAMLYAQIGARLDDETRDIIMRDAARLQSAYAQGGEAAVVAMVTAQANDPRAGVYWLARRDGTKRGGNLDRLPPLIDAQERADDYVRFTHDTGVTERQLYVLARRVALDDDLYLLVGRDLLARDALRAQFRASLLGAGVLALILGLAGGVVMARAQARRIEAVNRVARGVMQGRMDSRIAESGAGDEYDDLARNLNAMLDRIDALVAGLREVTDNIAHNMRSPLARMRAQFERALQRAESADILADSVRAGLAEADRMLAGFNALLSISRLTAGGLAQTTRFDLAEMATDITALYAPLAEEQGVDLQCDNRGAEIMVTGNRDLLAQACVNALENALAYGRPKNGAPIVRLRLRKINRYAELSIADNGVGIAKADRARALERFTRFDVDNKEGAGLGLPLIAAIAQAHRGDVKLDKSNEGGLLVCLRIPLD